MTTVGQTVGEIMSADLIHAEPAEAVRAVSAVMAAARVGAALVMQETTLLGIFTERDLLTGVRRSPNDVLDSPVGDWMTPNPKTVGPEVSVREAARIMLRGGFRHLPVVSGETVVGVVSLRDLAKALAEP